MVSLRGPLATATGAIAMPSGGFGEKSRNRPAFRAFYRAPSDPPPQTPPQAGPGETLSHSRPAATAQGRERGGGGAGAAPALPSAAASRCFVCQIGEG